MPGKRGRPPRLRIKSDEVHYRIRAMQWTVQAIVNRANKLEMPLRNSTVYETLRTGTASSHTIRALSMVLELSPARFVDDERFPADEAERLEKELNSSTRKRVFVERRVIRPNDATGSVQDVKNVISDAGISRRLIALKRPPCLYEAVTHSVMYTPINDAHKDHPFVPGTEFNHFLLLGSVVLLKIPGLALPVALGYHRNPGPLTYTYKHTKGLSVLWATGFQYGLGVTRDPDMQEWVELASETPREAKTLFTGGSDPVILRLFTHKLNLVRRKCTIEPLGIVTNCQTRPDRSIRRVYTKYVFRITVTLLEAPKDLDVVLRDIACKPDVPVAVEYSPNSADLFVGHDGAPLPMDTGVWRLLQGDDAEQEGGVTAVKGYQVSDTRSQANAAK